MKHFHTLRKAHMTLLETLIAVSLLSILLVFVFGFFRELSELTRLTEKTQKESFQMRYTESRLGFILERIVNENDSSRDFVFYMEEGHQGHSSSPSLIFTFNNEVRLDPAFSGDILGMLYVDSKNRLCLATWPLQVSDPEQLLHEEILMEHVSRVKYSFYAAPERVASDKEIITNKIDPEKKDPEKDKWHEEWFLSYGQMPSIVRIEVELEKDEKKPSPYQRMQSKDNKIIYFFVLPSSKNPIYYPPPES